MTSESIWLKKKRIPESSDAIWDYFVYLEFMLIR